jgi:excisionase family DNA binding protein
VSTPTVDKIGYRPKEAAAATGLSRARIYELMAEGVITYRQIGGVRLIHRTELDKLAGVEGDVSPAGD